MRKTLFISFGIFICLIFYLLADCFVSSTNRASRAATITACWGDSITLGSTYRATGKNYPAQLQGMLNAAHGSGSYRIINRGVNGYRAEQVLDHASNWLAADNPNIVLLMIGTNDMSYGQTIKSTRGEVQKIINLVIGHINPDGSHSRIIVSSIIPSLRTGSGGSRLLEQYNDDLGSHLRAMDSWFTSNWDDFYDRNTRLAKESLMADDIHPNASGYKVMARNWFEAVTSLKNPPDTPSAPTGPDNGSSGASYNFTAVATDPDEDQIAFKFDWGDTTQSNWSPLVDSGSSVTMSHSWSGKGNYYVRVMVKDSHGDSSDWSSGHLIVITTVVLAVDPLSLSFGNMKTGSTKTMSLRVYNSGEGTLSGTISVDSNWASVNPTSFEGNEHTISVTVNSEGLAESTAPYGGTIAVASNGGDKTVSISVAVIPGGAVAYPNPVSFSRHTGLTFWGTSVAHAKIQILTLTGELVKTLEEIYGADKVSWDGRNEKGVKVVRGIYIFVVGNYRGKLAIVN